MFRSSVPDCKAHLVERWSGRTLDGKVSTRFDGLAAVTDHKDTIVSWGNPHPDRLPDVLLIIDDTEGYELEFAGALTQANESYTINGYISVAKNPRVNRQRQWQRAYDLWSAVLTDIADMNHTGELPSQVSFIMPGASSDSDAVVADMREDSISFQLHVTARISDA